MPELFIELFSEEIPARLQARGAEELRRLVGEGLSALTPTAWRPAYGPRRIALAAEVAAGVAASSSVERGPRVTAPAQALAGFLRKHGATQDALREEAGFWVLKRATPGVEASELVASIMPGLLRRFAWPKAMRWGGVSAFTWIRPLRRILCLLDGVVVPFALADGGDDGHGLASGNLTEGHRFHAPGPVAVSGFDGWQAALRSRHVVPGAEERAALVRDGVAGLASARGLSVVEDPGLVEEVAGLVEWPVPLLGRIDDTFMDLPPEVMQVSMRVNQRYFATRAADGMPAPWFAFVANIDAPDGGAAIVAGNERVLRARFADARHFWDLDRRTRLADRVAALDGVVFQAELGSQGARARRLQTLATRVADDLPAPDSHKQRWSALAARAALLCKADLVTGMVGEFPELQGVMGSYYAAHDGEDNEVVTAIRDHYAPRGPSDVVPKDFVSCVVALADKIDQLTGFFLIGAKPTGSGDPYALRRAALGIVRILKDNELRIANLRNLLQASVDLHGRRSKTADAATAEQIAEEVEAFVVERLRIQLRAEGRRSDIFMAVRARSFKDLVDSIKLGRALEAFLETAGGGSLLALSKRAGNILRIEEAKDGLCDGVVQIENLSERQEMELFDAVVSVGDGFDRMYETERYADAIEALTRLGDPLNKFFDHVTVNDSNPDLRRNRLNLLAKLRKMLDRIADFSLIEA